MGLHKGFETLDAADRKEWRKWLSKNHSREQSVWLIIHSKKSPTRSVTHVEALEEALCFGWIDSRPSKRDANSHFLLFSKRNPESKWSTRNRQIVERLLEAGRMAPPGLRAVSLAKKSGTWDALTKVDAGKPPTDLTAALRKNPDAQTFFNAFPKSSKKIILEWIENAKRPETRKKRIAETVQLAAQNIRANHYRQPKKSGVRG